MTDIGKMPQATFIATSGHSANATGTKSSNNNTAFALSNAFGTGEDFFSTGLSVMPAGTTDGAAIRAEQRKTAEAVIKNVGNQSMAQVKQENPRLFAQFSNPAPDHAFV